MSKRHSLWALFVLRLLGLTAAWGQDGSAQQPAAVRLKQSAAACAGYGPDNSAPSIGENPPISGLDVPNLEPHAAPVSYLSGRAHLSESVNSNLRKRPRWFGARHDLASAGQSGVATALEERRSVPRLPRRSGRLQRERYWPEANRGIGSRTEITWKRGQLGIRDAFSYQPEGTFG